jgi:beta-N-acetylhexosaminidase
MTSALIIGLPGPRLGPDERAFLRDAEPWGAILFGRNIENPEQVRRLTGDIREALGRTEAPVLIDQEGGRVQRLRPPHWPSYPAAAAYSRLYDRDPEAGLEATRLGGRLIAADLMALGITVDCTPVADVPVPGSDPIVGDRAYGDTPRKVAVLANAMAEGLLKGGVLPVVKHLPGHGRATADSHKTLPRVSTERGTLEPTDFAAFRALAHLPLGMTAHVLFTAIDQEQPATTSPIIIGDVIRGSIGFGGALMSDDIAMAALSGPLPERTRAAVAAGCDLILHCSGRLDDMRAVAAATPALSGISAERAATALASRKEPTDFDAVAARRRFLSLLDLQAATAQMAAS